VLQAGGGGGAEEAAVDDKLAPGVGDAGGMVAQHAEVGKTA